MLNEQEVIRAHDELKESIVKLLWEFSDKYFPDKNNFPQSSFIMQAVLSAIGTEVEYQVGKMAPFTNRQRDHICYQIGDWYIHWKNNLTDPYVPHRLGFAKEQLKTMICGD
jgi:hypothetical protein